MFSMDTTTGAPPPGRAVELAYRFAGFGEAISSA